MNKKGQALVEFVIILPILLLLFFGSVDIARIAIRKNELENLTTDIIELHKKNKTIGEMKQHIKDNTDNPIDLYVVTEANKTTFNLSSNIDIITPGLNKILSNPYKVENKRVINNE